MDGPYSVWVKTSDTYRTNLFVLLSDYPVRSFVWFELHHAFCHTVHALSAPFNDLCLCCHFAADFTHSYAHYFSSFTCFYVH